MFQVSCKYKYYDFFHFEFAVEFGDWFDWVLGWEKEIDKGDLDIHLMYYENLKKVFAPYSK